MEQSAVERLEWAVDVMNEHHYEGISWSIHAGYGRWWGVVGPNRHDDNMSAFTAIAIAEKLQRGDDPVVFAQILEAETDR